MASVCGSVRSNASSKYRRVSSTSSVDQSLFGSSKGCPPSSNARRSKNKAKQAPAKQPSISLNELQQIKRSASMPMQRNEQSPDDDGGHSDGKPHPTQTAAAQARKEHMKQLERHEIAEQKKAGSLCDGAKLDRLRRQAQEKLDEGQDVVKLLETCRERATTFAIRDQQLRDKAERDEKERAYERRMILAMEVERLTEIEAREAAREERAAQRVADRRVIEGQIEARARARLLREEAREQENREMRARAAAYRAQDEARARERRERASAARAEVLRANEEQLAQKRELARLREQEDERMVAYQLEKDEALRRREAAEVEAERERRAVQKRLNDEHERSMDRQAELDELRARRATEDAERKHRQRRLAEAQKKQRDMDALDAARQRQQREKLEKERAEAEQKRKEHENALRHARAITERERAEAERTKAKNGELIVGLQAQIEENATRRMALEKEKYREGTVIKQQLAEEKAKMEAVREKMVGDMKSKGIDERYFGEMTSLDINKFLMKY